MNNHRRCTEQFSSFVLSCCASIYLGKEKNQKSECVCWGGGGDTRNLIVPGLYFLGFFFARRTIISFCPEERGEMNEGEKKNTMKTISVCWEQKSAKQNPVTPR